MNKESTDCKFDYPKRLASQHVELKVDYLEIGNQYRLHLNFFTKDVLSDSKSSVHN